LKTNYIFDEYYLLITRRKGMNNKFTSFKIVASAIIASLLLSNCVTTYDAQGVPVQTVDPGAAVVGAVAVGAIAYAVGQNNSRNYYRGGRRFHRGRY